MFTDSNGVDAGGLIEAGIMLGVTINEDMRQQLGIDIQSAFDAMVPLDGRGDIEDWL